MVGLRFQNDLAIVGGGDGPKAVVDVGEDQQLVAPARGRRRGAARQLAGLKAKNDWYACKHTRPQDTHQSSEARLFGEVHVVKVQEAVLDFAARRQRMAALHLLGRNFRGESRKRGPR